MAKNTVLGGNPLEPIHGFDGATGGEIIQSTLLVKEGTDTPLPSSTTNGLGVYPTTNSTGAYGTTTVDTTAVQVRAAKASRRSITLQNVHASNDLYVGFDVSVGTANGMKVPPGGSWTDTEYSGAVWAIATAAGTDTRWQEVG